MAVKNFWGTIDKLICNSVTAMCQQTFNFISEITNIKLCMSYYTRRGFDLRFDLSPILFYSYTIFKILKRDSVQDKDLLKL